MFFGEVANNNIWVIAFENVQKFAVIAINLNTDRADELSLLTIRPKVIKAICVIWILVGIFIDGTWLSFRQICLFERILRHAWKHWR